MNQSNLCWKKTKMFFNKPNLLLFFTLFYWSINAQCPTGTVSLYSQTDINNFVANYPNCTQIEGSLYISGATDLSSLSNIVSVNGDLHIEHSPNLTSLQGLNNLSSISSGIILYNLPELASVEALSNITSLNWLLSIYNTKLTSLFGLHNITSIGGGLSITDNTLLTDISALENINPNSISDTGLYIVGNTNLSVCNLDNICTYLKIGRASCRE